MNKTFNHLPFPIERYKTCERVEGQAVGRLYRTAEGNLFPSVTSVLSIQEKPELDAWRKRVGEEEANRVSLAATTRGTYMHNMAEAYIMNRMIWKDYNPLSVSNFMPMKKELDVHVDNIFASELKFYSDKLKVAGTTDLIAEYDGVMSVIDYKTSLRIKYASDIKDYFIQSSVYAMMAYEMFGLEIRDIVIIMLVNGAEILVFKEKVRNHMRDYVKIRKKFKEKYNI